ncbi:MAG: hypothetical protein H7Y41_02530 [Hyphomonadaceae bacterium]|nr:hypothetical protein [Clostridia bacterium]
MNNKKKKQILSKKQANHSTRDRILNDLLIAMAVSILGLVGLMAVFNSYQNVQGIIYKMGSTLMLSLIGAFAVLTLTMAIYSIMKKRPIYKMYYLTYAFFAATLSCVLIFYYNIYAVQILLAVIGLYLLFSMGFAVYQLNKHDK